MNRIRSGLLGTAIAATTCGLAAPSHAQTSDRNQPQTAPAKNSPTPQVDTSLSQGTALDDIVVTARKQRETAQSIPATVRAIGATELANAHVTRIDDLGTLVPNLNITVRADQTPDVVIRGVGSFGLTTGVGFYLDDVQLFDGQTVRPTDLDRVEVLKGPQGTLYGGSNIGGAIKYVSQLPTDKFHADGSVEYGSNETVTVAGAVSGPLIGDTVTARLSAYGTRTSGYAFDPILDRNLDRGKEYGGRLILQAKGADTTAILYLSANKLDSGTSSLYYRPGPPNDPSATRAYSLESSNGTLPDFQRTLYSATLNVQQRLSDSVMLTSISSYFHSKADTVSDVDKGPLPFLVGRQHLERSVWSQEIRLSGDGSGRLKWIVGAFALGNNPDILQANTQFIGDPPSPANLADPTQYATQTTLVQDRRREYAVFGNLQYSLGKVDLEIGVRGDYSRSQTRDALYGLALSEHDTQIVPKFSASYHVTRNVMAYGLVSRGFQPGGVVEGFDPTGAPYLSSYRPETTWNYELGLKTTLGPRAHFNLAAFYLDYRDRLFQSVQFQGAQFVQTTSNIGPSKNYGVEADLAFELVRNLVVTASGGFTRAEWKSIPYIDVDGYDQNGVRFFDGNGDPIPQSINLKGRTAPFTPAYQASLTLDWTHDITPDVSLGLRGNVTAFGKTYWDVTDHYSQEPYSLVNLGARLRFSRFTLSANVQNLFDKRFNTTFISAAEVGAPNNVAGIGRPRTWSAGLSFRY
jgi:iron complex outermembrane receptor protein